MAPKKGENAAVQKGAETQAAEGKRASSRDILTSLEGKVTRLEESVKDSGERLDMVDSRFEDQDNKRDHLKGEMEELLTAIFEKLGNRGDVLEAELKAAKIELEEVKAGMAVFQAVLKNVAEPSASLLRKDIPKPNEFKGNRSAQDVENFVWGMEQYFRVMGIKDDAKKVTVASMYLTDVALLWWRRRCSEEESKDIPIETWKEFQVELKDQLCPSNAQHEARKKLWELKHEGSIPEYVKEFIELKLQILNLSEAEGFFTFTHGLPRWAEMKLVQRGVKDLSNALTATEAIAEFEVGKSKSNKPRGKDNGGGDEDDYCCSDGDENPNNFVKPLEKRGPIRCHRCGGPHMVRNCSKRGRLNAIANEDDETEKEECRLGAIASVKVIKPSVERKQVKCYQCKGAHIVKECPDRVKSSKGDDKPKDSDALKLGSMLLNSAKASKNRKQKGLMYVDINVAGQKRSALVDTRASHLFVSKKAADEIGLKV
ncbi:hypothetical protein HRI_002248000 [Hibiscus trionum]|uniref:Retrotransposon gag domain-containing protein n=1 Tax=Hibiscus trionum TaxID=183268 RepID=A0A9W7M1A1_HIBTR|nr:hypothetical protein HRI_002248000 [Hibiscus trionum]